MKIDLTNLNPIDQVALAMKVLHQRMVGGARETHASDLHGYFKHRGFRSHDERTTFYSGLLAAAGHGLGRREKELKAAIAQLEAGRVITVGNRVLFAGAEWRVTEVMPEGKVLIKRGGSVRTVRMHDCQPVATAPTPTAAN
jgi:hypothetical protein